MAAHSLRQDEAGVGLIDGLGKRRCSPPNLGDFDCHAAGATWTVRGAGIFPVGRRGAQLIERQPAVRFPDPLSMPFKVANPRLCRSSHYRWPALASHARPKVRRRPDEREETRGLHGEPSERGRHQHRRRVHSVTTTGDRWPGLVGVNISSPVSVPHRSNCSASEQIRARPHALRTTSPHSTDLVGNSITLSARATNVAVSCAERYSNYTISGGDGGGFGRPSS
jgi:hypothetical protein